MAMKKKKAKVKTKRKAQPAKKKSVGKASGAKNLNVVDTDVKAKILAAIERIPRGRVCTYGDVADVAGLPRRARLVGTVLRQTPASRAVRWYRVINAGGRISFPTGTDAYARQRQKLEAEGVVFAGGRVDLQRYGWPDRNQQLDELLWGPASR
jgi:methylated-DNA-protein-cysteine methyltransferase related protein